MCIIYKKHFTSGYQNVFLVEVSNINDTQGEFCISQLCLMHKNTLGIISTFDTFGTFFIGLPDLSNENTG